MIISHFIGNVTAIFHCWDSLLWDFVTDWLKRPSIKMACVVTQNQHDWSFDVLHTCIVKAALVSPTIFDNIKVGLQQHQIVPG